jgi:hypothetical protein
MAILKGDWVLVEGEGVGEVILLHFNPDYHLVQFKGRKFANVTRETRITKIDPAFHKLLTDVHKESDDDG